MHEYSGLSSPSSDMASCRVEIYDGFRPGAPSLSFSFLILFLDLISLFYCLAPRHTMFLIPHRAKSGFKCNISQIFDFFAGFRQYFLIGVFYDPNFLFIFFFTKVKHNVGRTFQIP